MLGMSSGRRRYLWMAATVAAAGAGLRLWFILHAPMVAGDSLLYGAIAKNWMRWGVYGFSGSPPAPTLIRLPGYPMFLALSFRVFGMEHYTAVMGLQAAVDLGTWVLVARLAHRLMGRRAGMAALVLGMLCPFTAIYASAVLAETLTLFTIALAFFSLERWAARGAGWNRWLLPLTFALAYGLLLRPEQGLLAAAVVPAMLWIGWEQQRSRERRALRGQVGGVRWMGPVVAVAVGTLLPLLPWAARNWKTFHVIEPLAPRYATDPGETPPLGFQRWFRTWGVDFASTDDVYWPYDGSPIEVGSLPARAFDSADQRVRTAELLREYDVTSNPTPALDVRFAALAEERIRGHGWRYYVVLPAARLLNMELRPRTENLPIDTRWWRYRMHAGQTVFALGWAGLNLAYVVVGVMGVRRVLRMPWLWRDGRVMLWAMVAFCVMRACLLLTIDNSEPRYTLEFFPLLVVGAAAWFAGREGLGWTGPSLRSGEVRQRQKQIPPLRS